MTLRHSLFLSVLMGLAFSTREAEGAGKAEKGLTLRLLACEVSEGAPKVFLETQGSKSAVFELPSSGFSEPMALAGRAVELKTEDNGIPPCAITLPDEGKSFAVLLAPKEPAGFTPFVVRLDDDSFKPGDYYLINCGAKTLALKLGATEVILEGGSAVKSRPTEPVHEHHYVVTMTERGESGDKVFASTRWPVVNNNRSCVIFTTGTNGKTTYRAVDPPAEKPGGEKKR